MQFPDIKTLGLVTMILSFLISVGLFRFAFDNRRFFSIRFFAYGDLLLLAGLLLSSFKPLIPDVISLAGSNVLIILAYIFFILGSASFLKVILPAQWLHWFLLVLTAGALVYIVLFDMPSFPAIIIINTFLMGESVYGAILFLLDGRRGLSRQKNNMAAGFLLVSAYSLLRVAFAILELNPGSPVDPDLVFAAYFIVLILFLINSGFSLIWISCAVLEDDLERRARLDALTGALNRRAFLDELNREIARSKRESLTFSLLMGDIDHFKEINDRHGHLAGDSVLMAFKTIVERNLRINDVLSRYGEEEFMILLPNTEKKNAVETAERIRKIVEMNNHPFNGQDIRFTVSFGVTSFDMDARNKEELLENTDIALYEAKSKGRNRVESK
ncbi:MAG: GGDEF domain-containing protein [Spirochaetales bacterium]|nr:GGDEF domain-containing protein [Spirochaetales bacterium]